MSRRGRDRGGARSLHVRGYNVSSTQDRDLRQVFENFGQVVDVYLPKDYFTKELRGFAYIQFADEQEAEEARTKLDRSDMFNDGREVHIMWAAGERKTPVDMRRLDVERDNPHARRLHRPADWARERERVRSRSPRDRYPGGGRKRYRSPSPRHRRDRSPYRRSPIARRARSRSPLRRSPPPYRRGGSPSRRRSRSPPPYRARSRSPPRRRDRSPRRRSRSPPLPRRRNGSRTPPPYRRVGSRSPPAKRRITSRSPVIGRRPVSRTPPRNIPDAFVNGNGVRNSEPAPSAPNGAGRLGGAPKLRSAPLSPNEAHAPNNAR